MRKGTNRLPLGRKLNAPRPWRWILNCHPGTIWAIFVGLTIGVMWTNDLLIVHGRILHPNEQWVSALFDAALSAAIAVLAAMLVAMLRNLPWSYFPVWLRNPRWHAVFIAVPMAIGITHVIQELASTPELYGPNWLWHNVVMYPLLGYPLILLIVANAWMFIKKGVWRKFRMWAGVVFVFICIGGWAWAGDYDTAHQRTPTGVSKHELANPRDPWCGGLITVRICGPAKR